MGRSPSDQSSTGYVRVRDISGRIYDRARHRHRVTIGQRHRHADLCNQLCRKSQSRLGAVASIEKKARARASTFSAPRDANDLGCHECCFGPVAGTQGSQERGRVNLACPLGNAQLAGDLLVRHALSKKRENFILSPRQPKILDIKVDRRLLVNRIVVAVRQPPRHIYSPGQQVADCGQQFAVRLKLVDESMKTCRKAAKYISTHIRRGHHGETRCRSPLIHVRQCFQRSMIQAAYIHQDQVVTIACLEAFES